MNKKKIAIVEANMTGLQHAYPNGVYCSLISELYGKENISLYCSSEHLKAMKIGDIYSKFKDLRVISDDNKMIQKFFVEINNTFGIINETDADVIIFLSCFPDVQFAIQMYAKLIGIKKKIVIFTHGELEGLLMSGKWKVWSYPFWISLCMKNTMPQNVYRIVLGKSIMDNLNKLHHDKAIFYIDQPRDNFSTENKVCHEKGHNNYSFIGDFLEKKGSKTFLDASKVINSNSRFVIIGKYHPVTNASIGSNVCICGKNGFIEKDEFDELIKKTTYACYPYPTNSYRLTASGAVLDAIRFLKPIIYIANDYFDSIFEGAGNIGYRCKNETEFIRLIQELDNSDRTIEYKNQVENLKKLQQKFGKENIKNQLQKILNSIEGEE